VDCYKRTELIEKLTTMSNEYIYVKELENDATHEAYIYDGELGKPTKKELNNECKNF